MVGRVGQRVDASETKRHRPPPPAGLAPLISSYIRTAHRVSNNSCSSISNAQPGVRTHEEGEGVQWQQAVAVPDPGAQQQMVLDLHEHQPAHSISIPEV